VGGLQLGADLGGGASPDLVGQAPVVGEDALVDPAQRLGVGLLLLPDDRLQLLDPAAHGPQPAQHLLVGGADQPRRPGGAGQLLEPADDLVAGAAAARSRRLPPAWSSSPPGASTRRASASARPQEGIRCGTWTSSTASKQACSRAGGLLDPVGDQLLDLGAEPAALVVVPGRPVEGDRIQGPGSRRVEITPCRLGRRHSTALATTWAGAAVSGGRGRRATRRSMWPRRRVTARRRSHRSTATPSGLTRTSTQFTG
jgi:hypothetical protein